MSGPCQTQQRMFAVSLVFVRITGDSCQSSLQSLSHYRLTKKGKAFAWTDEFAAAFQRLKQVLTAAPVLAFPESDDDDFIVDTDVSDVGIGCVLSRCRMEKSGSSHTTAGLYCVNRKELLAVVTAEGNFHHYLYGRKFLVRSDHASLQWLLPLSHLS